MTDEETIILAIEILAVARPVDILKSLNVDIQ